MLGTKQSRIPNTWFLGLELNGSLLLTWDDSWFGGQVYARALFAIISTSLTRLAAITTSLATAAFRAGKHRRCTRRPRHTRRLRRCKLRRIVESIWVELDGAEHDWP